MQAQKLAIAQQPVRVLSDPVTQVAPETPANRRRESCTELPTRNLLPSQHLLRRAEQVVDTCKRNRLDIRPIAVGRVGEDPKYYAEGDDWSMLIVPAGLDPTRKSNGKLPIPREVAKRLKTAVEVGIDFDRIYVAHELGGQPLGKATRVVSVQTAARLIPQPPPAQAATRSHRALEATGVWGKKVGAAALAATLGAAALAAAPLAILDPALVGILLDQPSEPAVWFRIDSWAW